MIAPLSARLIVMDSSFRRFWTRRSSSVVGKTPSKSSSVSSIGPRMRASKVVRYFSKSAYLETPGFQDEGNAQH
eukprot:11223193-Lingulodinium_polyedra.AAC.1